MISNLYSSARRVSDRLEVTRRVLDGLSMLVYIRRQRLIETVRQQLVGVLWWLVVT